MRLAIAASTILIAACGKPDPARPAGEAMSEQDERMMRSMAMGAGDGSVYGPLEVGGDLTGYVKMNTTPVSSETHGGRLVDTYVNAIGAAAYFSDDAEIPVGTILVKTSMEVDAGGRATGHPGPTFVMEKQPPGFDPERGDYSYAIHYADPPEPWRTRLGGPIYWRTPSPRVNYCFECHDNYDRLLGGVPGPQRIETLP